MSRCRIYYWDNAAGVRRDSALIKECLDGIYDCDIFDFSPPVNENISSLDSDLIDIGIFVQNWSLHLLERNKINICIPNEEWLTERELSELKLFDYVICKSKHSQNILKQYGNTEQLYFWSKDMRDDRIFGVDTKVHFAGKSIQKNTDILLDETDLTIIDSTERFRGRARGNYIDYYLSDDDLKFHLNNNNFHICPSLYEAHGHYMFEGMTCDKTIIATDLPVWTEQIDPDYIHFIEHGVVTGCRESSEYEFLNNDNYPLREGYIIDPDILKDVEQWEYWKNNKLKPRKYILDLFEKNKKAFKKFLKSL